MKEYNIKAIVDKDEMKLIFECDKEKNKQCKGYGNCRECNYTTNSQYMKAKARQFNKNITDKEIIINLENEIDYYRHKMDLLKKVHEENRYCINKQDELKELNDNRPNITIRNNKNVYVTINNFNETEKEYNKELITEDKMQESFNYINNKLGKEY